MLDRMKMANERLTAQIFTYYYYTFLENEIPLHN